ncbi:extracellular solute-binding protein [Butyrivibrio sp. VCB2001]|uniref:extracellular solute-binding protein n=1 Tax=Butyrivibrio sp. VCB2001 TaxID=1280667 RepID=UPI000426C1B3|nr:extracellular solute-binding protein [Butyrivibrio sp. VCB2001]
MRHGKRDFGKRLKAIMTATLLAAVMLLLSACAGSERKQEIEELSSSYAVPQEKQLIVYTSHKEEVYLPIIREFESRTGIWVELHTGGTTQMFSEVKEASEQGRCDIMFGGGIESYEAAKDLFMPYEPVERSALDPDYVDDENRWIPFTELPIVFVYNKKLVSYSELPTTWEELFDSKWKGQIAFADPNSSGTSYTILSTMEQLFNEEPQSLVPRFYEQLEGRILPSSGQVIPEVSDGSFLIGITLEETARKAMDQYEDISMLYPEDGTSAVPDGIAMVKNAPHSYNAGKFIDFVVSYDTQRYATENFYRRSARRDVGSKRGNTETFIKFDVEKSAREEEEVFSLWNALAGQEGE